MTKSVKTRGGVSRSGRVIRGGSSSTSSQGAEVPRSQLISNAANRLTRRRAGEEHQLFLQSVSKKTRTAIQDTNAQVDPTYQETADGDGGIWMDIDGFGDAEHGDEGGGDKGGDEDGAGNDGADEDEVFVHNFRQMLESMVPNDGARILVPASCVQPTYIGTGILKAMPEMVEAFINWQHGGQQAPSSDSADNAILRIIDIFSLQESTALMINSQYQSIAAAIIAAGYIPSTPVHPEVATSIKTLELLHRLRLRHPSFSIQAYARVICDFYTVVYVPAYREILSAAYDVYLLVTRAIHDRVQALLRRDTAHWRVLYGCPLCSYKVKGEKTPKFRRIACMDGNNSQKRVDRKKVADDRVFESSDYFIPRSEVDAFADEVKSRSTATTPALDPLDKGAGPGDPCDGDNNEKGTVACKERWKAANPSNKKMWSMYDETGIFASACRHGLILWIADMVKSGELAKYPLAIMNRILHVLKEPMLIGFDIGCVFGKTCSRSCLGADFLSSGCRICVNAFHGYAHCIICQKQHHPLIIEGCGIEDLETMECIFGGSNALARIVRYATAWHRRLWNDTYFQQWDEDKYTSIGTFLLNNLKQALQIIEEDGYAYQESLHHLSLTEAEILKYIDEERSYILTSHDDDNEWPEQALAYVEALKHLTKAQDRYDLASDSFINTIPMDFDLESMMYNQTSASKPHTDSDTRAREAQRRLDYNLLETARMEVAEMEAKLGIQERWTSSHPLYVETIRFSIDRDYQKALSTLEHLLVQRLFELQKLNVSATSYKMRTKIAGALSARSNAIRTALTTYNNVARATIPPRPTLEWERVTHYEFLDEVLLLQHSQKDIQNKPWVKPVIRQIMRQYHRVLRAREELERVNLEVHRMHTFINDETNQLRNLLWLAVEIGDPCAGPLSEWIKRRTAMNDHVLDSIYEIYEVKGYTGKKTPGIPEPISSSNTSFNPTHYPFDIIQNEKKR